MSITRTCDYCEKPEADVLGAFVQHYRILPTRPTPSGFVAGARTFDLCQECVVTITSPATSESIPAPRDEPPLRFAGRGGPVLVTDGKGTTHVVRERNRAGRCEQKAPSKCEKGGARCIWDTGHEGEHKAANGQHWKD